MNDPEPNSNEWFSPFPPSKASSPKKPSKSITTVSPNSAASSFTTNSAARACSCNKRSSTSCSDTVRSCFSTVNPLYSPNLTSGLTITSALITHGLPFSIDLISIVG